MSALPAGETKVKTCAGNLVILGGDEMAELPIDAINSRCRPRFFHLRMSAIWARELIHVS
jgi:hypothetical protein